MWRSPVLPNKQKALTPCNFSTDSLPLCIDMHYRHTTYAKALSTITFSPSYDVKFGDTSFISSLLYLLVCGWDCEKKIIRVSCVNRISAHFSCTRLLASKSSYFETFCQFFCNHWRLFYYKRASWLLRMLGLPRWTVSGTCELFWANSLTFSVRSALRILTSCSFSYRTSRFLWSCALIVHFMEGDNFSGFLGFI